MQGCDLLTHFLSVLPPNDLPEKPAPPVDEEGGQILRPGVGSMERWLDLNA